MQLDAPHLADLVDDWYRAWNAHDLEAILGHYAPRAVFTSPAVARLGFGSEGTIVGRRALRRYFGTALARSPELRFEPLEVLTGPGGITLVYRNQAGRTVAEMMLLAGPLVRRAIVHYGRPRP